MSTTSPQPNIDNPQPNTDNNNNCSMVGLLGILIQIGLGALSFSVLIFKRYRQNPKRPWKIWAFDTSKQVISQLIAHFINLTISLALSYNRQNSDQCLWYFITNVFDNTIGVLICVGLLRISECYFRKKRKFQLLSGNYYKRVTEQELIKRRGKERSVRASGQWESKKQQIEIQLQETLQTEEGKNSFRKSLIISAGKQIQMQQKLPPQNITLNPTKLNPVTLQLTSAFTHPSPQIFPELSLQPQLQQQSNELQTFDNTPYLINYKAWILQLMIWNFIVIIAKCCLFGLQFGLKKPLETFSVMILGWIQTYPVLELIVVIVIVPVIMNGLAYWVQDNFLMKKEASQGENRGLIEEHIKQEGNSRQNSSSRGNGNGKENLEIETDADSGSPDKVIYKNRQRNQSLQFDQTKRFQFHDDYETEQNQKQDKFANFANFTL